jgi:hypothetical protein
MAPEAPFSLFFCLMRASNNKGPGASAKARDRDETLSRSGGLRQTADAAPRMKWKMMEIAANISKM